MAMALIYFLFFLSLVFVTESVSYLPGCITYPFFGEENSCVYEMICYDSSEFQSVQTYGKFAYNDYIQWEDDMGTECDDGWDLVFNYTGFAITSTSPKTFTEETRCGVIIMNEDGKSRMKKESKSAFPLSDDSCSCDYQLSHQASSHVSAKLSSSGLNDLSCVCQFQSPKTIKNVEKKGCDPSWDVTQEDFTVKMSTTSVGSCELTIDW